MEGHRAGFHFSLLQLIKPSDGQWAIRVTEPKHEHTHLDINLVSAQHDGNVLAYTLKVTMPIRDILVCDSRGDVEHNDTTLALNVVSIAETTKFLLSGGVPDVETNGAEVGRELQGMYFDTEGGYERQWK